MTLRNAVSAALLTLLVTTAASAAPSQKYVDWGAGPVQWIMTPAEKSAWRHVQSDQDAISFIDLFWVRRDPTPGTPQNEVRDEHDARERSADERFTEKKVRGSLTDRGRAWYVLGPPPTLTNVAGDLASGGVAPAASGGGGGGRGQSVVPSVGTSGADFTGGRQLISRESWIWDYEAASAAFGLPRLEIVFVTDGSSKHTTRDLYRKDYSAAEGAVLSKQIVNDVVALPPWAAFGGLEPRYRATRTVKSAAPIAKPASPAPPADRATPPAVIVLGASRLTLVEDAYSVDATSNDPFSTLRALESFSKTDDLGWVAQYCTGTEQETAVPYMLRITGTAAGRKVDRVSPLDELVPDRLKSSPGCGILRGALPLADFAPGRYTLELSIEDPAASSVPLRRDFTVE